MAGRSLREVNAEILNQLDVAQEFQALGVRLSGEPRASGMVSCYAFGREDRKPSAWINVHSGYYGDSGGKDTAASTHSLWDFAVLAGKFTTWQEARKAYAQKVGLTVGRGRPKKSKGTDWREKLEFQTWDTPGNDILATRWCLKSKPGITPEAIKAAGGQLAYYPCWIDKKTKEKKQTKNCRQVIALPCYGQWGLAADPVAWVIWDVTGQDFDVSPKDHPPTELRLTAKMLSIGLTSGATIGLAGLMALVDSEQRSKIQWVWKTAGATDLLTFFSALPNELLSQHVILTNASGEVGDIAPHQAKLLAGLRVAIVGDCDQAGVVGAEKWCRALDGLTKETRAVRLPWPIEPSGGKDLRDFLGEHSFSTLLALLEGTLAWEKSDQAAKSTQNTPESPQVEDKVLDLFQDQAIAKALRVDVLGSTGENKIKVYSEHLHRTTIFGQVSRLKYEDLIQYFGTPVRRVVSRGTEDVAPGMYPIHAVREALAHLASGRLIREETELGLGCWPVEGEQKNKADIVLVGAGEALWYGGPGQIERITHPRFRDHLLSFESGAKPWYEFDQLVGFLRAAEDQAWRSAVMDDLCNLWARWHWRGKDDVLLVCGLVLATWVQTLWAWRPRIDVLGASNTGKSMLCMALAGLYRDCCVMTSDTTAAGLRQAIRNSALTVVVDEVDAKNQAKMARQLEILEMLRSASRGIPTIRGTGAQRAMEFVLQHLVWIAGISIRYDDEADRNRSVTLNLLPAEPEKAGKLVLPAPDELHALGQRALAVALWATKEACRRAIALKDERIENADPRLVESYSVPAAMLAVALGYDEPFARELLANMLSDIALDVEVEPDETSLISELLSATVRMGQYEMTVGQTIEHICSPTETNRYEWGEVLGRSGIKITNDQIVLQYQAVKKLLVRTRWEGQSIQQYLRRIPGRELSIRRVGGVRNRVIIFNLDWFRKKYIGEEYEKPFGGEGF